VVTGSGPAGCNRRRHAAPLCQSRGSLLTETTRTQKSLRAPVFPIPLAFTAGVWDATHLFALASYQARLSERLLL